MQEAPPVNNADFTGLGITPITADYQIGLEQTHSISEINIIFRHLMLVSRCPLRIMMGLQSRHSNLCCADSFNLGNGVFMLDIGAGDYAYVDRSSLGNEITVTLADGTVELDSLNGDENTFVVDASSEFDFMGFSHDPAHTDDSEVVVLEGV